jgi:hypothetical protein
MSKKLTEQEVFDAMMVAMAWLAEEKHAKKSDLGDGWKGNGILAVLKLSGVIDLAQYRQLTDVPPEKLRTLLTSNAQLRWPERNGTRPGFKSGPSPQGLSAGNAAGKLFVVRITTPMYFADMILKPRGYNVIPTPTGVEYGLQRAPQVGVTKKLFREHWDSHCRHVGAVHVHTRDDQQL